jgi:hypothetical protein
LLRLGRTGQAIIALRRGLEEVDRTEGKERLERLRPIHDLAAAHLAYGEVDAAEILVRRGLGIVEATEGLEPQVAADLWWLAARVLQGSDPARARLLACRAKLALATDRPREGARIDAWARRQGQTCGAAP